MCWLKQRTRERSRSERCGPVRTRANCSAADHGESGVAGRSLSSLEIQHVTDLKKFFVVNTFSTAKSRRHETAKRVLVMHAFMRAQGKNLGYWC